MVLYAASGIYGADDTGREVARAGFIYEEDLIVVAPV
jgi:hypothetical protein